MTGRVGRTLHYRTKEAVSAEEFEQIQRIVKKYNAGHEWAYENIKLWKGASGALWGFTKVNDNDRDRKLVIQAIREMSKATPRLTWMFYDEGGLEKGKWGEIQGWKIGPFGLFLLTTKMKCTLADRGLEIEGADET